MDDDRLLRARHEELERRLTEIAAAPEQAFGVIGLGELLLAALVFVALPVLLVVVFR